MDPPKLPKCNAFCNYLPCMYADDSGCSTSDPTGAVCKKKNENAKQVCQGSHLTFLCSFLSDGKFSPTRPEPSQDVAQAPNI